MFRAPNVRILAAAALLAASQASAQTPRSPVVNADRSVTFTISAPFADKVYVGGEFDDRYNRPPGALMTRDDKGVWTYTTQPLEPGIYYYGFSVDGLFTIDPGNTRYRAEIRTNPLNNVLEVRGDQPFPWELTASTPRGTIHIETFESVTFKRTVQAHVYTPPNYAAGGGPLPVLYLLHGNPGVSTEWRSFGFADQILDNLISQGKTPEMIVVMPDTQVPLPYSTVEQQAANLQLFEKYLLEEVMPLVESRYRVNATQPTRWVAGFSRGGVQSFQIALRRPDLFSAIGAFSSGIPAAFPDLFPAASEPGKINGQIPVIYYSIGKDDSDQKANYERATSLLDKLSIRYETTAAAPGGHIWRIWRNSLAEFLTRLR